MPIDVIGGLFLIAAAVVAAAASDSTNRVSIFALLLGALGAYLVYNGYLGRPSYLKPWLPYI